MIKTLRTKISVHPAFALACSVLAALGYGGELLILLASVTLHELAHVLTAKAFGIKVERWTITPLGQSARFRGLESAPPPRRAAVLLAGPLLSLLLFALTWKIDLKGFPKHFIAYSNLVLSVFNLLPAYPLDGGRIIGIVLGNRLGVLRANRRLSALSKAVFGCVMAAGFAQAVLYPFNISLLCAGLYLYKTVGPERVSATWELYNQKLFHAESARRGVMPVRFFLLDRSGPLMEAVNRLCWDYLCVFYITENGEIAARLTEGQIAAYIREKGFSGTVWEAVTGADKHRVRHRRKKTSRLSHSTR